MDQPAKPKDETAGAGNRAPRTRYVIALDQGTTSTRAIIFDHVGSVVATSQSEHDQRFPRAGWVEHDPMEIWANCREVIGRALARADLTRHDIAALGITNQRGTSIVWDRRTGQPVHNAIVWQDTRTHRLIEELALDGGHDRFRSKIGVPLATNFSATKIRWVLDNVPGARDRAERGELLFGTVDSWIVWNLTGGVDGGIHVTDVTNASQTMLMDLHTLAWDLDMLAVFGIPAAMMAAIKTSSEVYGTVHDSQLLRGTPVAGMLGDQQAAAFGQAAFDAGEAKNTYGTGCFLIFNTGQQVVLSARGLLTTVAYQLHGDAPRYALEGSVAVAGSLVQWLRDNLGLINTTPEVESLARTVPDNGGVYLVPAFSGLFAPYWQANARGVVVGLTHFSSRAHIARAAIEATAFQTAEVLDAINLDAGEPLKELRVDGGMVVNETLMQFQADILGVDVLLPEVTETTALGAAYAAGLAVGYWTSLDECAANWHEHRRWRPRLDADQRDQAMRRWRTAVTKAMDWVDRDVL